MSILDGLRWRYQSYIAPYRALYRGPGTMVRRYLANRKALAAEPVAFIYAEPSNSGDYASYLGVRHLVGQAGVELFAASLALKETVRTLSRPPGPGRRWQAVFVGGGGLFQNCFDGFWERLLELEVPLVVFGVGANQAGNFRQVLAPEMRRRLVAKAVAVHVRDRFTQQLFADYPGASVTVGVCPSVNYLHEAGRDLPRAASHLLHVCHPADLSLTGVSLPELRDAAVAEWRLGLAYDETDHLAGLDGGLLRRYARAALVVSSRLHGCIFSYALGKPFLAIECDRKVGAFLECHAQDAPCLQARTALTRLSPDLLAEAARRPPQSDRLARMADNVTVMRGICEMLSDTPVTAG